MSDDTCTTCGSPFASHLGDCQEMTAHRARRDGNPDGYKRVALFDGGEVLSNGRTVVVLASPHRDEPEDHPDSHNCDAMGCGSSHVIWRGRLAGDA